MFNSHVLLIINNSIGKSIIICKTSNNIVSMRINMKQITISILSGMRRVQIKMKTLGCRYCLYRKKEIK